ncbi:hypothetical protein SDC9_207847 [bioreactor metagenome]|uniref:Uncharacterized protein n=1 Tax=bioreactor metagenome TaxID=1076179 RepID=A0A645JAI3_9ZZZZ
MPHDEIQARGFFIAVIHEGEFGVHAVMTVNVGVVQISILRQGAAPQIGADACFPDSLLGDEHLEALILPVPVDMRQRFKFLRLTHEAVKE